MWSMASSETPLATAEKKFVPVELRHPFCKEAAAAAAAAAAVAAVKGPDSKCPA